MIIFKIRVKTDETIHFQHIKNKIGESGTDSDTDTATRHDTDTATPLM